MKTNVHLNRWINSTLLLAIALLFTSLTGAQIYTTKSNGDWNTASTWVGGAIPNATNIPAGAVINIQHSITYSGSKIVNYGTIIIANPSGIMPKLVVAGGVNFTNNAGASFIISSGEYVQYRFVGGGQSGTNQNGTFTNNGGYVNINGSYVEVAQKWINQSTGIVVFNNSSVVTGQDYQTNNTSIDTLSATSVSVGWQGTGNFQEAGSSVFFQAFRAEIASNGGSFNINPNVIANGEIDYITLTNDFTGVAGNGQISIDKNIVTTGLILQAYCISNASNYQPNGMVSGSQTSSCSSNYFPASLAGSPVPVRMNFGTNPVLISGTDRQAGAKYLYQGIAPGVDAIVSIDSIVGGAVINVLDDNTGSNGGFVEAFQPQITSGPAKGVSYAVFTFTYNISGTSVLFQQNNFSLTAIDIDGSSTLAEFDQISAGPGAVANYVSTTPSILLSQMGPGTFLGINTDGISKPGVDTTAKVNMFTVNNTNVSGFTAKMGISTSTAQQTLRLFSLYTKGFNYPSLGVMPVKLVSFDAILNNSVVNVKWTTAIQQNVSHFIVQRSTDGTNFTDAGIVFSSDENSTENINYSLNDNISAVKSTILYYRLCTVDFDGGMQYSDIRVIRIGSQANSNLAIITYPNPVHGQLNVTIPATWQAKKVSYQLYNASGQISAKLENGKGSQTQTFDVSNLPSGLYIVKVTCDGQTSQQKIVKF